jgi:hypothetical protein
VTETIEQEAERGKKTFDLFYASQGKGVFPNTGI